MCEWRFSFFFLLPLFSSHTHAHTQTRCVYVCSSVVALHSWRLCGGGLYLCVVARSDGALREFDYLLTLIGALAAVRTLPSSV